MQILKRKFNKITIDLKKWMIFIYFQDHKEVLVQLLMLIIILKFHKCIDMMYLIKQENFHDYI